MQKVSIKGFTTQKTSLVLHFDDKLSKVRDALFDYLKWFEICPIAARQKNIVSRWGKMGNSHRLRKVRTNSKNLILLWKAMYFNDAICQDYKLNIIYRE
jgi:hypothetical protein